MSITEVSFANFTSSRQMLTGRVKVGIIRLIREARNAYEHARNLGNEVLRQEQIAMNLWREITHLIYPNNERLQQQLYDQGRQNLQNNVQHITNLLASGTVSAFIQISRQFQEQISSGLEYIQNVGTYIQGNLQTRYDAEQRTGLEQFYRRYQQRATNGESFIQYIQRTANNYFQRYSHAEITSFLNSRSGTQDTMARGAQTHRIVPYNQHQQTSEISAITGGIQNAYNQMVQPYQQAQQIATTNAPTTNAPTTTSPTTTQTPTSTALTPMQSLAAGSGPTSGGQHGETGVELLQYTKFHPFKRTEQVLMPFYNHVSMTYTENTTSATQVTYRLNSIYDIIHAGATFSTIDPNTMTILADQPDAAGGIQVPMMREYWKQFYSYWHVVKCEWKFSILPPAYDRSTNIQFQLFFYEHGIQQPPITQTVGGTAKLIPHHVRQYHPHVRQHTIQNISMDDQRHNGWQTITGVWRPGDIQHEVAEDEFTRVWHKFEQVPPTAEKLTILLQLMDGFDTGGLAATNHVFQTRMTMHYTVQLKDLKTQYEFITEATGIPAVTTFTQKNL